jgi:phosphomethylpyrimidine synthase
MLSGSGRIEDIKGHPQARFRGETNLVKITEDVRKYAAEQGTAEEEALQSGMAAKAREFTDSGGKIYQKA